MVSDTKQANRILAAALYSPKIHGNKFRITTVAEDIIDEHIHNTTVSTDTDYADYIVKADIKGDVSVSNNRCMGLFNSKMGTLHKSTESSVSFEVKRESQGEVETYWYDLRFK